MGTIEKYNKRPLSSARPSGIFFLPSRMISGHCVEGNDHLSHAGRQRRLLVLALNLWRQVMGLTLPNI